MEKNKWLLDVNQASFQQDVLDRSYEVAVLVDFWAPWCGPCRTLGPILEKLLTAMKGTFVLAKINSDENPEISRQYGVRSIPAVKLFIDGAVKDEFTGALPERSVRQFLEHAIPSPQDRLAEQANLLIEQQAWSEATSIYHTILAQNPRHAASLLGVIQIFLHTEQLEQANAHFKQLPSQVAESLEGKILRARLVFSGEVDNVDLLRQTAEKNPADLAARLAWGHGLVKSQRFAEGMEQFLEVIRRDRTFQDQAGRKALLQVFDLLGFNHPLVAEYRPKLSALLFS